MLSEVGCPCPSLCRPSTLFLSLHRTSPHALCSLDVCALNPYLLHSLPIIPILPALTQSLPCPPPALLRLHLVYHRCLCCRCLIIDRSTGRLSAPLQLPRSGAWCRGSEMCPRLEVYSVTSSQTHMHNLRFLWEGNRNIMVWGQMAASSHHFLNSLTSHEACGNSHRARCMYVRGTCVCAEGRGWIPAVQFIVPQLLD